MPVIQQENGIRSVKGLPLRWGKRAYHELHAAQEGAIGAMPERYIQLSALLDEVTDALLPPDATYPQICIAAERYASECQNVALDLHDMATLRAGVEIVVQMYDVDRMDEDTDDKQAVLRYCDPKWWRNQLSVAHKRAKEHAAMRLAFVSSREGKYCSNEAAHSRVAQNRRNVMTLKSIKMHNLDTGQEFALDKIAETGMGNNKIRRGELMLRMDGCEDVALALGHVGIFVTLTAPGAYHSVIEHSGRPNPKYNNATPRHTQEYFCDLWARTRTQNGRDGIAPYGFRVAEPHHDGCTHWHMMLFMPQEHVEIFKRNLRKYALEEDGNAPGAQTKRVTFEVIDPSKGSAAAYMAKYIGKNIGENKIEEDAKGNTIISKEMRVDAWAGVWGIRQFQPIGQPPVTGYRELRRVPEEAIEGAPEHVKQAWLACNRLDLVDEDTGEVVGVKRCDFGQYIWAQGGVNRGRDYRIGITTETRAVAGRYGMQDRDCPVGLHCKSDPEKNYASTHYTWRRSGVAVDVRVCRPWSPVNNCTPTKARPWEQAGPGPVPMAPPDDSEWWGSADFSVFDHPDYQEFATGQESRADGLERHARLFAACERYEMAYPRFYPKPPKKKDRHA
jgi:hypothetical protein